MEEKDTQHLEWIYTRLYNVYLEEHEFDYMKRFKQIIEKYKK